MDERPELLNSKLDAYRKLQEQQAANVPNPKGHERFGGFLKFSSVIIVGGLLGGVSGFVAGDLLGIAMRINPNFGPAVFSTIDLPLYGAIAGGIAGIYLGNKLMSY